MADVNINAGVTESHRFEEQAADVSTPAAGFWKIYFKEGGLYWIDDAGIVAGPIGSNFAPSGRLTLTTATPVTTADVTAAATLYYTPYTGNMISLYDGARWIPVVYTEKSLSLVGYTASKPYDIFGYINAGTLALESLIWTNGTTRATALAYQNGRLVKSGAATRLYLGTIYINSSGGQTDDAEVSRNVFNYYNRVLRRLHRTTAAAHTYTTGSWRAFNGDATQIVTVMCGVSSDATMLNLRFPIKSSGATIIGYGGIGYDATNATFETYGRTGGSSPSNSQFTEFTLATNHITDTGYHYYAVLEYGATTISLNDYSLIGGFLC